MFERTNKAREQAKASKGGACDDATSRSAASTNYAKRKKGVQQKIKTLPPEATLDSNKLSPVAMWRRGRERMRSGYSATPRPTAQPVNEPFKSHGRGLERSDKPKKH